LLEIELILGAVDCVENVCDVIVLDVGRDGCVVLLDAHPECTFCVCQIETARQGRIWRVGDVEAEWKSEELQVHDVGAVSLLPFEDRSQHARDDLKSYSASVRDRLFDEIEQLCRLSRR
jgi:hypothetical protein